MVPNASDGATRLAELAQDPVALTDRLDRAPQKPARFAPGNGTSRDALGTAPIACARPHRRAADRSPGNGAASA